MRFDPRTHPIGLLLCLVLAFRVSGDSGGWREGFAPPGTFKDVRALHVHDDGSGSALIVGGAFDEAFPIGGRRVKHVARWTGTTYEQIGAGFHGSPNCFATLTTPEGPVLVAGGQLIASGGTPLGHVARWDGRAWQPMGQLLTIPRRFFVREESGSEVLYATGDAIVATPQPSAVARWDGEAWVAVGALAGEAHSIEFYDDGRGTALFASGILTSEGGFASVQRWDGKTWQPVDGAPAGPAFALCVHDDGSGEALYVGGDFASAGGTPIKSLARWDGTTWSPVGSGITGGGQSVVWSLRSFDPDRNGLRRLLVAGRFEAIGGVASSGVAVWNGEAFEGFGSGVQQNDSPFVRAVEWFDDGTGPAMYLGGEFSVVGGVMVLNIARWNGSAWRTVAPCAWVNERIDDFVYHDDGSGTKLYAAGQFSRVVSSAASPQVPGIARWDGAQWQGVGSGVVGTAYALASLPGPGGSTLYAAGALLTEGGQHLLRWDGTTWHPLLQHGDLDGPILDMAVWDDGTGPALYVGGSFTSVKGVEMRGVARFDGANWSALAGGVTRSQGSSSVYTVRAVEMIGKSGPTSALVVGGNFDRAGGVPATLVAAWDGSTWDVLGASFGDPTGSVRAIGWRDSQEGRRLVVGGWIDPWPGTPTVVEWTGNEWSQLGPALNNSVYAIEQIETADGKELWVGGSFTAIGGEVRRLIARFNGRGWDAIGEGLFRGQGGVRAIAPYQGGGGMIGDAVAVVGGGFLRSGEIETPFFAAWSSFPLEPSIGDIAGSGSNEITLSATVVGTIPLSMQWRRDGVPLTDGPGIAGSLTGELTVDAGMFGPAGSYDLVVASPIGVAISEPFLVGGLLGDLNGDGEVNSADLAILLGAWGTPAADLDGDGVTGASDLAILLASWT